MSGLGTAHTALAIPRGLKDDLLGHAGGTATGDEALSAALSMLTLE